MSGASSVFHRKCPCARHRLAGALALEDNRSLVLSSSLWDCSLWSVKDGVMWIDQDCYALALHFYSLAIIGVERMDVWYGCAITGSGSNQSV